MLPKIIAVVGPTASGKTALSISLAKKLHSEVISCDSMQIYRGMEIGTAAPTPEETGGVQHHMVSIVDPSEPFSCADYAAAAEKCAAEIRSRGMIPIFCGGTGLYLDSLLHVSSFSDAEKNEEVREKLQRFAEEQGSERLHARLAEIDPQSAASIHPNNVRRVIRAIEIYETTGIPKSEWDHRSVAKDKYDAAILFLDFHDREKLYRRIDLRVDLMMRGGLPEEAEALYRAQQLDSRYVASQAIGFKEFLPYFAGEWDLDQVAEAIKLASRRYAKRQLTWFRRYGSAIRLYPDTEGEDGPLLSADALADEAIRALESRGFIEKGVHR